MKLHRLTTLVTAALLLTSLTACSPLEPSDELTDNDMSTNEVPLESLQTNEIASMSFHIDTDPYVASVGFPPHSSRYSFAILCAGQDAATTAHWSGGTELNQGIINIQCTPNGSTISQEIAVPQYAEGFAFTFSGLKDRTITLSFAPTPKQTTVTP